MVATIDKYYFDFEIDGASGSVTFEFDVIVMDELDLVDFDIHYLTIWSWQTDENGKETKIELTKKQLDQITKEIKELILDNPDVYDFEEYLNHNCSRQLSYYYEFKAKNYE